MSTEHAPLDTASAQYWEDRYSSQGRQWSGRPNPLLVEMVQGVAPGRALDLGCGEGGDTLWLAQQGWQVTATDVSATALQRTLDLATEAGVDAAVRTERHDLNVSAPTGPFDLVSAQYFMSNVEEFDEAGALRAAAATVAPGGLLLVVRHGSVPHWAAGQHADMVFATPAEVLASLDLPSEDWTTERLDAPVRVAVGPQGDEGDIADTVVALRRR